MTDDICDQIEADVRRLEEYSSDKRTIRDKIITKLDNVVQNMKIDPDQDKPSAIEAKMNLVNTLLKTISDAEGQAVNIIKLKQNVRRDKVAEDSAASISAVVTEFLKTIKPSTTLASNALPESSSTERLDNAVASADFEILDSELEMGNQSAKEITTE